MRRWVLLGALLLAAPAHAATTFDERVRPVQESEPGGDFVYLGKGPGEGTVVREELAKARPGRAQRRRSIAYFAQLSDFQLTDEESPARVEVLDQTSDAFSSAFRPMEALLPFITETSIRAVNRQLRSPVPHAGGRRARLRFVITTGDNADNQQRNETVWVQTLLDGGRLDPNSGKGDPAALEGPGCDGADPVAIAAEAPRYTGVQDYDDYVESGTFYDPDRPAGLYAQWPQYPGLMDRAQRPFEATGLKVPSYVALGNHDALVQGNQAANAQFDRIARGCTKAMGPAPANRDAFGSLLPQMRQSALEGVTTVPPDPDRELITKAEYRKLFEGEQADAHGFAFVDESELEASRGAASYYAFSPVPGLRMIAIDTVATGGAAGIASDGNLDHPQFEWLQGKLDAARRADELVIVYSHHGPTSMTADLPDEAAGSCDDPQDPTNPGCDADPRDSRPIHLEDDMVELLASEPNVIAWVAGHSHLNDVAFRKGERGSGFWVVRTSAEADWPHQDRLIEVMDNRDGTLSLFGTLIDSTAPAAAPPTGDAAGFSVEQLASLGRTFGYNDPDAGLGASGAREDRNVELLVADPRRGRRATAGRLRLRVRPKRVTAGRATTLRARVRRGGRPVKGARVRARGVRARTNARGRARLRVTFAKPGKRVVRARKGARRARAVVRVVRR